jgi:hypothetical protein
MPALIDSSPECVQSGEGYVEGDDLDFILQANYEECAGFMTFGPGSTYGPEGIGAATSYMVLTWIGIAFMVACLIAWIVLENRRLTGKEQA